MRTPNQQVVLSLYLEQLVAALQESGSCMSPVVADFVEKVPLRS
jgi:hypothetical protein